MESGGDKNGEVDDVIRAVNSFKSTTEYDIDAVREFKALLDDLYYLTYVTITSRHEQLAEDEIFQDFVKNVFPAATMIKYETAFGSVNNAIIRKRFTDEIDCSVEGETNVIQIIKNLKEQTNFFEKIDSIFPPPPGVPPRPPRRPPALPEDLPEVEDDVDASKFARSIEEATYSGVKLDEIDIH